MRLFHVSETPGIAAFEPRPTADGGTLKVWAIEDRTLANYLLPRECPRVCLRAGGATDPAEIALLEGADAIVAIKAAWLERVRAATLHLYDMPAEFFALEDQVAGYWTSPDRVVPSSCRAIEDLPGRIAEHGARLMALPSLWPLHDRVRDSRLAFSMIRMRNAAARSA